MNGHYEVSKEVKVRFSKGSKEKKLKKKEWYGGKKRRERGESIFRRRIVAVLNDTF